MFEQDAYVTQIDRWYNANLCNVALPVSNCGIALVVALMLSIWKRLQHLRGLRARACIS